MIEFPHVAPKGYSYEYDNNFKRNITRVWIVNLGEFSYKDTRPRSVWGFYNTKRQTYHAPIDVNRVGSVVHIDNTTPYSAMQILKQLRPTITQFLC